VDLDSAILYSQNVSQVTSFYKDILGFPVEYEQPGKYISFLFKGGGRLGIKTTSEDREKPGYQTVFISTEKIEELANHLQEKGIKFRTELADKPWGKEFSILDPDGNKVLFIQRT